MVATAESPLVAVYQFHVLLLDISPAIWRRVLVRSNSTVADLHDTLQIVMGWDDDHLHRFVLHGKEYGLATYGGIGFAEDPQQVRLCDWHLRPKERLRYEYDFHAHWQHQLRLEQILPLPATGWFPLCIGGARHAPPEGCGGAAAFLMRRRHYNPWYIESRMVEIVEMLLDNPAGGYADYVPELRELRYWLTWEQWDRRAINRRHLGQLPQSAGTESRRPPRPGDIRRPGRRVLCVSCRPDPPVADLQRRMAADPSLTLVTFTLCVYPAPYSPRREARNERGARRTGPAVSEHPRPTGRRAGTGQHQ